MDLGQNGYYDVIIVDLNNLYMRGYFACMNRSVVDTETYENYNTGGLFRVLTMALGFWTQYSNPEKKAKLVFVSDYYWQEKPEKTNKYYRRLMDPEYKANRKPMDPEVKKCLPILIEALKSFGVDCFIISVPGYEADDCVPYLTHKLFKDKKILLISKDSDWNAHLEKDRINQLAGDEIITQESFEEANMYPVGKVVFRKSIRGDAGDGIPVGVRSIREEVLTPILNKYNNFDDLLEHLDNDIEIPSKWKDKIKESSDRVHLNEKLVHFLDIPENEFNDGVYSCTYDTEKLFPLLEKYDLLDVKQMIINSQDFLMK
jgi:hypothetical protein